MEGMIQPKFEGMDTELLIEISIKMKNGFDVSVYPASEVEMAARFARKYKFGDSICLDGVGGATKRSISVVAR